jgi:hypothetical protein
MPLNSWRGSETGASHFKPSIASLTDAATTASSETSG